VLAGGHALIVPCNMRGVHPDMRIEAMRTAGKRKTDYLLIAIEN